jgi:hypothetical protein
VIPEPHDPYDGVELEEEDEEVADKKAWDDLVKELLGKGKNKRKRKTE